MAKVRCPCGRQYNISDEFLGKLVKCGKCGESFEAKAVKAAPRAAADKPPRRKTPGVRRLRIGDMAVQRGLISREQLDTCLEYQMVLNTMPGENDRRLGQILVEKGLLRKPQLARLLGQQQEGAAEEVAKAAAEAVSDKAPADHPVSKEHREKIRRTLEAATRKQAERQASTKAMALPGPISRLRLSHFVLAGAVAVGVFAVIKLWPPQAAQRTLVAYLLSCSEDNVAPDNSLAVRDLSLDVRSFHDVRLLGKVAHDYAAELKAFAEQKDAGETWADLLATAEMPEAKKKALSLAVAALPASVTPRSVKALSITVQPATLWLVSKPRGMGMFRESGYRFVLLEVETPSWGSGWKVAGYEDIGPGGAG